jgi:hypothetical protein
MDEIESGAQSFIVKVWVEERAEKGSRGVWRGHITHVSDNRRRYLKSLDEIGDYIAPYLEAMSVQPGMCWRFRRWFRQLTG